jgi:transposase-like protein
MGEDSTTMQAARAASLFAGEAWFDPIEAGIRERIRGFIEALFEEALTAALGRSRCERAGGAPGGYRNGTRERQLLGSFGPVQVSVPRARTADAEGGTREWRSSALPRYARMRRQVEALIAEAYLAGTNTRRVRRALQRQRFRAPTVCQAGHPEHRNPSGFGRVIQFTAWTSEPHLFSLR